jgi:hypothetical protein
MGIGRTLLRVLILGHCVLHVFDHGKSLVQEVTKLLENPRSGTQRLSDLESHWNLRMLQMIHEERGVSCALMHRIVDCEFNKRKQDTPCSRELVTKTAQDVFDNAIDAFCLAIRLRMSRRRHRQARA